MNRKEFLKSCGLFGVGSCIFPNAVGAVADSLSTNPPVTPCEEKQEFALKWVKRFFDNFDRGVPDMKKKEIMESCGRSCFNASLEGRQVTPVDVDVLIDFINKSSGEVAAKREGNVIDFHYIGNPKGLKVADGFCLCPLVESGPTGLSPTYCECSVGYVSEMFETYTGKEVSVDLLASLKRGDRTCRFRITLLS